jgi:hypothetical protein
VLPNCDHSLMYPQKTILRLESFSFDSHSHFFLFTQRHLHFFHKIHVAWRISTLFNLYMVQFIFWTLPLFFWFRVSPCQILFLDLFRVILFLLSSFFFILGESTTRGSRTHVTRGRYPSSTTITPGASTQPARMEHK